MSNKFKEVYEVADVTVEGFELLVFILKKFDNLKLSNFTQFSKVKLKG